jgi:putative membrane protein
MGRARTVAGMNTSFTASLIAHSNWHHDGIWWLPFGLFWLVVLAAATWFVVRNVKRSEPSAMDILAKRYARGELSTEEYRERLEELRSRQ